MFALKVPQLDYLLRCGTLHMDNLARGWYIDDDQ